MTLEELERELRQDIERQQKEINSFDERLTAQETQGQYHHGIIERIDAFATAFQHLFGR